MRQFNGLFVTCVELEMSMIGPHTLLAEACTCYLVTFLNRIHIFDWRVGSVKIKEQTQRRHMSKRDWDYIFKFYFLLHTQQCT